MSKSVIAALVVLILVVAGVGVAIGRHSNNPAPAYNSSGNSSSNTASNQQNSQIPAGSINIRNMMFTPSQISVQKGATVTWTNNDSTTHTVVDDLSNVGGPNSGDIAPGTAYSFTFTKNGSFQYHCTIHPSMRGTIVVH